MTAIRTMEASIFRRNSVVLGLFACYLLTLVQTFGVYMTRLSEEFDEPTAVLGIICGLGLSLEFLLGPFGSAVVNKLGFRWAVMAGGTLQAVGISLCYFAESKAELIIYLGVLPGLGSALIYVSGPGLMACYFKKNYSTVMGIVISGAGAGILLMPPLVEELISTYGLRGTFLIHGALTFNIVCAGAICKTELRTKTHLHEDVKKIDVSAYESSNYNPQHTETRHWIIVNSSKISFFSRWFHNYLRVYRDSPLIILVYIAAFLLNIAYSSVVIHVFNQIVQSGHSERQAALALSLLGVGSLLGRLFHGFLIDARIFTPPTLYLLSLLIAAGASFVNPIFNTYILSLFCAACIGITSGIQFPLIFTILRRFAGEYLLVTATGLGMFTDGCGLLVGGYLAGFIKDATGDYRLAHYINASTYLLGACFFFPIVLTERQCILVKMEDLDKKKPCDKK